MKKLMLFAVIAIAAMGAVAQDAKKGCDPKACKPGNTKVEEAAVITSLRAKVVKLSEQVTLEGIKQDELIGNTEDESLALISSHVSRLSKMINLTDYKVTGSGAALVNQLTEHVDKLILKASKNH